MTNEKELLASLSSKLNEMSKTFAGRLAIREGLCKANGVGDSRCEHCKYWDSGEDGVIGVEPKSIGICRFADGEKLTHFCETCDSFSNGTYFLYKAGLQ